MSDKERINMSINRMSEYTNSFRGHEVVNSRFCKAKLDSINTTKAAILTSSKYHKINADNTAINKKIIPAILPEDSISVFLENAYLRLMSTTAKVNAILNSHKSPIFATDFNNKKVVITERTFVPIFNI